MRLVRGAAAARITTGDEETNSGGDVLPAQDIRPDPIRQTDSHHFEVSRDAEPG